MDNDLFAGLGSGKSTKKQTAKKEPSREKKQTGFWLTIKQMGIKVFFICDTLRCFLSSIKLWQYGLSVFSQHQNGRWYISFHPCSFYQKYDFRIEYSELFFNFFDLLTDFMPLAFFLHSLKTLENLFFPWVYNLINCSLYFTFY